MQRCYPSVQGSALQAAFVATAGEGAAAPYGIFGLPAYATFLGIPWVGATYTSSVIPVIFIIAFAAQVQKLLEKNYSISGSNLCCPIHGIANCFTSRLFSDWSNH